MTAGPPNGVPSPSSRPTRGAATVYHFADGGQQLIVPTGFKPLSANPLTLFLFGFPPRPKDPAAQAQWMADLRHFRGSAPPGEMSCPYIYNGQAPLTRSR